MASALRFSFTLALSSFVSGDVEELDGTEKNTLKVFKSVTLIHEVGMVLLEVSGRVWEPRGGSEFKVVLFEFTHACKMSPPSGRSLSRLCHDHKRHLALPLILVDRKPYQRHVRRRHRHRSAGGPSKSKSPERSVSVHVPCGFLTV